MNGRIVLAGAGSGVGKTTIAAGIMRALSHRYKVQGFKVGPDFIDPMYHTAATGRPSRNLDSFLMEQPMLRNLFGWATRDADLAVVEGVRGLYDGLTATGDTGSTAEIAKLLDAPVILIVNARSLAKSAAAHVLGFKMLDPQVHIAGVILNQVSGARHRQKAVEAVEQLTHTPVIGVVERQPERLPERHLGLHTLYGDADPLMDRIEEMVSEIDLDRLLAIAESAPQCDLPSTAPFPTRPSAGLRIAVPRDRAFCFYYPENLEALEAAGATLTYFRPTEGESLPKADAIYLGGGYPELFLNELSSNTDFLEGVRQASLDNKLIYGECGGMMMLCRSIDNGKAQAEMAGIIPSSAVLTSERQGLAYVRAVGTPSNPLFAGREIRAHEFHYTHLVPLPPGPYAYQVKRGTGLGQGVDGAMVRRTIGSYMHQHALATTGWGTAFVDAACRRGAEAPEK